MDPCLRHSEAPQRNAGFDEQRPRTIIADDVLRVAVAFAHDRQAAFLPTQPTKVFDEAGKDPAA